MIEHT